MAAGIRPNVRLAKDAGLEIGTGIKVNSYLQTSDPSIYAGGDCVENVNIPTGESVYTPLGSVANKHGRVIGDNITGGKSEFKGVMGTMIKNKLEGLIDSISIIELKEKFDRDEDFVLLDVRTEEEHQKGHIQDERVMHIPLDQLRGSLQSLDEHKQKEIIVVCQIGSRAYEAARILLANGYNARIADGCMALWTFG